MNPFIERKFRLPRAWSNDELRKFAALFEGDIVNVSGWKDKDKEGGEYKDYFTNKKSYAITNYVSEAMGFQGQENEIFLDLTKDLPDELRGKFDVAFNHTVLEHIFEVHKAFENLCKISNDIVILVLPFLQPMHADYGDYWRFTPTCIQKLFESHGMTVLYSSFNNHMSAGVYVFCIASKKPEKWRERIKTNTDANGIVGDYAAPFLRDSTPEKIGTNAILNIQHWLALKMHRARKKVTGK